MQQLLLAIQARDLLEQYFQARLEIGDAGRMKSDYELVQTYLGIEKPFPVESAFTARLLDPAIKMDSSKVGK